MRIYLFIFLLMLFSVFAINAQEHKKSVVTVADIREIILETGDGFCFDCERVITLRANNAPSSFHGGKNSYIRHGDFIGKLAAKDFTKLAQTFIDNGFFNFKPRYEGTTSDVATVKITVFYKIGIKTSENFGASIDLRFRKIEKIFNAAADKIIWQTASETGKEKNAFAHLADTHVKTLKNYIGKRSGLRLALESDCENPDGLAVQHDVFGAQYHPFYAVWDFDKDKKEDFVVVLFNERAKPTSRFSIIVFKGAVNKKFKPVFTIPKIDLSSGGIELNELKKGLVELRIVHFQTKQGCTILRWRVRRFVLTECPEEEN